ncbi:MAG: aryl-sulfate sulfotransferase [Sedimentisphaerales bacterium]|nr:aryl-sulfate sulfotransferase [Sedimentisphaerales bacterium]
MKKSAVIFLFIIISFKAASAELGIPGSLTPNFPHVTTNIYDSNAVGEGYIFLTAASDINGVGNHLMILNNDGTPYFYKDMGEIHAYDFKVQPNGLMTFAQSHDCNSYTGDSFAVHKVMNHDFDVIDSFQMGNGYIADYRDFKILPNGHALLFGNYLTEIDINEPFEVCDPNAAICGAVVQELDVFKNVVFQWCAGNFLDGEDMNQPDLSQFHPHSVQLDKDGHILLASCDRIIKINRCTGGLIWQFGDDANDFTFIGADPNEPVGYFGCSDFSRLPNCNILIYDDGTRDGTSLSKVLEYKLDEENRTAELVWQYVPDPNIFGLYSGSVQRLPNGNSLICRSVIDGNSIPACWEITPDGKILFDLFIDSNDIRSFSAYRFSLPPETLITAVTKYELAVGNTYNFADSTSDTGVSLKVNYMDGQGYNEVTVRREPFAPINPEFPGTDPLVLPVRVIISQYAFMDINADVSFDVHSFNFADPNILTVYHRQYRDKGLFIPLPTIYNYVTGKLRASVYAQTGYEDDIGEFIFCYPDSCQSAKPEN